MLSSLSADRSALSVDALSGEPVPPELLGPIPIPPDVRNSTAEFHIIRDTAEGPEADSERCRAGRALGIRSLLKIPLRLEGGVVGALAFLSETPGRYAEEDVVVARRVADHVSLALSHQRLAEEERRAAEERERAAQLELRVEALKEELATTRGYGRVVGGEGRRLLRGHHHQAAQLVAAEQRGEQHGAHPLFLEVPIAREARVEEGKEIVDPHRAPGVRPDARREVVETDRGGWLRSRRMRHQRVARHHTRLGHPEDRHALEGEHGGGGLGHPREDVAQLERLGDSPRDPPEGRHQRVRAGVGQGRWPEGSSKAPVARCDAEAAYHEVSFRSRSEMRLYETNIRIAPDGNREFV